MLPKEVRRAVKAGIAVIPQLRGAKVPLIKWKQFQDEPPTLEQVEKWAVKYPDAIWAMVCGGISGYVVLDFDDMNTFERYDLEPFVRSPSGGVHVWVKDPGYAIIGGARVDEANFPGLDVRSEGHLATFAGPGYKVQGRRSYALRDLPVGLRDLLESRRKGVQPPPVALPPDFTDYMDRSELLGEAIDRVAGGSGRNEIGFWLACQLRDERHGFDDAWKVMRRYVKEVQSINGQDPYQPQEAYNSLIQAYQQPARMPRSLEDKSLFNRTFKQELARDAVRQVLRSMKLGAFELEAVVGHPEEDEPLVWTIEEMQPEGSNVLLTGTRKVGKTTMGLNLARSLLDGKLLFGRFPTRELSGNVGYFNYEMSLRQFNTWLRKVRIENIDGFIHWPLRGKHVDIMNDDVFYYLAEQLKTYEVEYLIIDPWARAISGIADENDNSEVATFLERLDRLVEQSGVVDVCVLAHTGKAKNDERTRGASRLEDWADVLWNATRAGDDRFLRAEGRDVEVEEFMIAFDHDTGLFEFGGGSRGETKVEAAAQNAADIVKTAPGLSYRRLEDLMEGDRNMKSKGIRLARERGWVIAKPDPKHAQRMLHYPGSS